MTPLKPRPIIFIAAANDRLDDIAYLRNLPDETRRIHAALEPVCTAGLCEVVVRQNATLGDIIKVFQHPAQRNRIAIFHYAGHANGYQLLLEAASGKPAAAHANGLAAFLAQQQGLELVFLNGCSTQPQVQALLDAGIASVVATAQAIDDEVATSFAECFYRSLASSATVQQAYNEAAATLRASRGDNTRHFYLQGSSSAAEAAPTAAISPGASPYSRLPWMLYTRAGAEVAMQWSLPKAANDPLFGLPPLPATDLPETPFRHLHWFRRADAPIFFGRGREIRELYERITDCMGAPLVLYYGQSGVGKSSLLAAGLLPRLADSHTVRYQRRGRTGGVLGALARAVGIAVAEGESPPDADQFCTAWLALEAAQQQPLIVLLDQVEEIFTRPDPATPDELAQLLSVLQVLLGEHQNRPRGKLVLAFRKEWLAEIEARCATAKLARTSLFLERLDRTGIIEAIEGIANDRGLASHYGLTVEAGLAGEIADDLLADRGAAVAPTLQVLLSKLWKRARAEEYAAPHFAQDLYHELRNQGLLLDDFLDQQLLALRAQIPNAVETGLALDLLAFHTTPLGTAEERTRPELQACYSQHAEQLADLLRCCQELYLLTDPSANRPDATPASRLAHDTLAPLVRLRFDESDAPGQRAQRILESRGVDWQRGATGDPLDEIDLRTVEAGLCGMRDLTADEERLLVASRAARARRRAEEERIAAERLAAQERQLVLEQQSNRRLQMVVGILLVVSLGLLWNTLHPTFVSWRTRGPLVQIAGGKAIVGTNDPQWTGELTQQRVEIAPYQIEKYEVTNSRYRSCVDVGACAPLSDPSELMNEEFADRPVRNVNAFQAAAYCRWVGRRLPTEVEWERAARGSDGAAWPWGNEPAPNLDLAQMPTGVRGEFPVSTISVYELSAGASAEGVHQLIGNVWEWTSSSRWEAYPEPSSKTWDQSMNELDSQAILILRGGSREDPVSVTFRKRYPATNPASTFGFRCARSRP